MAKLNFQHHYSSLQCPSEIILICWFDAQEHLLVLSMLQLCCIIFLWKRTLMSRRERESEWSGEWEWHWERRRDIRSGGTRGSEYAGSDVKCFIMTEWLLQQSSGAAVSQQLPLE